jgi:hypothetical protein
MIEACISRQIVLEFYYRERVTEFSFSKDESGRLACDLKSLTEE